MPDYELSSTAVHAAGETYVVTCITCSVMFDAGASAWCGCDAKLRTLVCPHCQSCFCRGPLAFKVRFWNEAPRRLREHARRFGKRALDGPAVALPVSAPAFDTSSRPRVLIVDDEEPMLSLAACYVEHLGYDVTVISSPVEALLMTSRSSFDVVLTDALMPKMDGRELCRHLKELHGNRIKVVLMTSLYTATRFRTEARNVFKVDEHLAKPLRYGELRDALQRVAPIARMDPNAKGPPAR